MTFVAPNTQPRALRELLGLLAACSPTLHGDPETRVAKTSEDSRKVDATTLFVARRGERVDGSRYVAAALSGGAAAVLCERGAGVVVEPRIEVDDVRLAWGILAHELAGAPTRSMRVVGVTGTNGKTTVACLLAEALAHLGWLVARSGTLGFFVGNERLSASLTTPQPDHLAELLATAQQRGAGCAVLEVSSHALDQKRVAGLCFEVAAFTNLSQDHLDYHPDLATYGAAKARLFREYNPRARVLNYDDSFGRKLAAEWSDALTVSADGDARARLCVRHASFGSQGIQATVDFAKREYQLVSRLLGRHNLENLLVALGVLLSMGVDAKQAASALSCCTGVPGRLERCDGPQDDVVVVVDYAHTEDALRRALVALRELHFQSLGCVFGCGGDRDKSKRAPMGRVAAEHADRIYLTSDNPRSEDPQQIIDQVAVGLGKAHERSVLLLDRREAIDRAIREAEPGTAILVAGKGHEDYQIIGDRVLAFDDRVHCRAALLRRRGESG